MNLLTRILLTIITSCALICFISCKYGSKVAIDQGVIVTEKIEIRNSMALVSTPLKEVHRGQEVEILSRRARGQNEFVQVRLVGDSVEGWLESRHVVSKKILDESNKLAAEWQDIPAQATAKTRSKLNLRAKPGRDAEVIMQLAADAKIDIVGRMRIEKEPSKKSETPKKNDKTPKKPENSSEPKYESWYKVRLNTESLVKAGWLYAESVEVTPPPGLVGLQTGRHFAAWKPFGSVYDDDTKTKESHYITVDQSLSNKDDEADFDRVYVVTWDTEKHGYKSIYFENPIKGFYPLTFEQKGDDIVFSFSKFNKEKQLVTAKYLVSLNAKTDKWAVYPAPENKTKSNSSSENKAKGNASSESKAKGTPAPENKAKSK